MRYTQALRWINDLTNYEREIPQDSRAFRQPNAKRFLAYIGKAHRKQKIIHLAGSKGKGSTAAMTAALLRRSGYTTGLYTSPHLVDQRERIQLNGRMIGKQAFADHLQKLIDADFLQQPTYFEIMTFIAMLAFIDEGVDFIVLETGLGGRLDTTNVFSPCLTVITTIGKDHCHILGNSLREIATEKCGIIKSRVPVITCKQHPHARAVIESTAKKQKSRLIETVATTTPAPLIGRHQQQNFAMTLAVMENLALRKLITADWQEHKNNFPVHWPGRFQIVKSKGSGHHVVLDGAHNPAAIRQLVRTWKDIYGDEKATIIWGCSDDKDWRKGLALITPIAKRVIFCPLPSNRSVPLRELKQHYSAQEHAVACISTKDVTSAIRRAGKKSPVLITGSLYLVGDGLKVLKASP